MMNFKRLKDPARWNGWLLPFGCLGILILLTLLNGCSAVESQHVDPAGTPPQEWPWGAAGQGAEGIAYFLPTGRVHIYATRIEYYQTNYGIRSEPYEGGNLTNFVMKFSNTTNINTKITYGPGSTLILNKSEPASFSATTTVSNWNGYGSNTLANTQSSTNGSAPLSSFTNSFSQTTTTSNFPAYFFATNLDYTTTITTTITAEQPLVLTNFTYTMLVSNDYQADRANMFLLNPKLDAFHDDNFAVTVDNNGLLASVNSTNMDETGQVIVQLALAAEQAFTLAAGGFPTASSTSGGGPAPDLTGSVSTNDLPDATAFLTGQKILNNRQAKPKIKDHHLSDLTIAPSEIAPLVVALNDIIGTPGIIWNLNELGDEGVWVRPETKAVWTLVKNGTYARSLQPLLNRMVVEDVANGGILPIDFESFLDSVFSKPSGSPPRSIDFAFDPFNQADLIVAAGTLAAAGITIDNLDTYRNKNTFNEYRGWFQPRRPVGGIFYRPPMPYEIRLRDGAGDVVTRTVLLPNRSPVLHLDLDKNTFSSSVSSVVFTNGFISSYALAKPSSALAIASLPVTLINGITSSLTNLIQLKLNLATGQNSLNQAMLTSQSNQITSLNNQVALLNAKQALQTATTTNSTAH